MSVLINNNGTLNPIAGNGIQNTFTGTEAEVAAAMAAGEIAEGTVVYITDDNGVGVNAEDIAYDNTTSGLIADDVQNAIDELNNDLEQHTITVTADGVKTSAVLIAELMTELINVPLDGKKIIVTNAVLPQTTSGRVSVNCATCFREYTSTPTAFHMSAIQPGTNVIRITTFQVSTTASSVSGYMATLSNSISVSDIASIVPNNGMVLELQYKIK